MSVAIITGATSGLGREYVDAVVEKFPKIDEIWIISRRKERLQAVADHYPHRKFRIIPLDLSIDDDFDNFTKTIQHFNPDVKLLINDAGLIEANFFKDQDYAKQRAMIGINAIAPTFLINTVLKYMKPESLIINVCSTSAFGPIEGQSIYSSTKAYISNLSLTLHWELKKDAIKLLVMYPGNMRTGMTGAPSHLPGQTTSNIDKFPYLDMSKITRKSLDLVTKGRAIYTPGLFYKSYRVFAKIVPHNLLARVLKV